MSDAHSPIRSEAAVREVVKATGCSEHDAIEALRIEGWVVSEAIAAIKLHQHRTADIAPWLKLVKRALIVMTVVAAVVLFLVWVTR